MGHEEPVKGPLGWLPFIKADVALADGILQLARSRLHLRFHSQIILVGGDGLQVGTDDCRFIRR